MREIVMDLMQQLLLQLLPLLQHLCLIVTLEMMMSLPSSLMSELTTFDAIVMMTFDRLRRQDVMKMRMRRAVAVEEEVMC